MNNKFNDSLENWEKAAEAVKTRIYQETIYKKQKKLLLKPLLTAAALLLFTVGAIFLTSTLLTTKETQLSAEHADFRMFDERTVEIKKYELFYRDWRFLPPQALEYYALSETVNQQAFFYYMTRQGYEWDEKQRNAVRKRVKTTLQHEMRKDNSKAYYEKMFADLQITEEEYIDYYLLLNKEEEMLQDVLFSKESELDEAYGDAVKAYQQFAGLTDELKLLERWGPRRTQPMNPQPDLPFDKVHLSLQVTTNKEGEFIFSKSMNFPMYLGYTYKAFLSDIKQDIVKEELTRYSLNRYREALRTYTSGDSQKGKLAKELEAVLEILERTIETDYQGG
ncbi:hypothetical protein [Lysinibacillus odysseyi]|uniref:Uncharacterized protein n=1 Tax=Lysinibacillus odysseyi 34hs-1 = NBRC 100172 TaxID=1220589 RepID=A0A0A3JBZ5_9BACI|nr:hypothetical protein [Lysinibacillus odysseyi]KGR84552.1 hypothetical protein CD32_13345 [Lysinibacillus odysseyi 34hs-1 = NBRC 100172]